MAWILHLSDAHLGKPTDWQYLDDVKRRVIRDRERLTTQTVLRSTLASLGRSDSIDKFDAVVFSGDITNYGREDGYERFEGLLEELGSRRPDNNRIVVVPGNHDVKWQTPPGSAERYALFLKWIRKAGYVTPLLDGIDVDSDGHLTPGHVHPTVNTDEFLLLAMNSSNYCGTQEGVTGEGVDWDKTLRLTTPKRRKKARAELDAIRQHDLARISPEQLRAISNHLEDIKAATPKGDGQVRIAVLHHHLLPVSTREEIKTFESVTNLGEVRLFLRDRGFRVVLHGHKHEGTVFWDYVQEPGGPLSSPAHQLLVMASPGMFKPGEPTCRVLRVLPRAPHERGVRAGKASAPTVRIHDVLGKRTAEDVALTDGEVASLWRTEMEEHPSPVVSVYGASIDSVYERLQSLLYEGDDGELHDVVCVIEAPGPHPSVPAGYPPTGEGDEDEWFRSLLRWWQVPSSRVLGRSELLPFNHGERIYTWNGNAVERAAVALSHDAKTTRSIVLLIDPRTEAGNEDAEYPAFVLAQLRLAERNGKLLLDVVGYFRKQDLRSWWPLNVAELAKLQTEALPIVRKRFASATQGRIVTYASTALVDDELPRLAVTRLDRSLDDEPDAIWQMAYSAVHPHLVTDRPTALALWEDMLSELEVPSGGEAPRIATVGLQELRDQLAKLKSMRPADATPVYDPVHHLAAAHRMLAGKLDVASKAEQIEIAQTALATLRDALRTRLGDEAKESSS